MSNKSLNAILIASISILSVAVITLTVLIIREGKPVQYDSLYESQEEEENVDLGNTDFQEQTTEADEPEKVVVVTTRVNIRSTDSEDGMVYDTVEEGAAFEFIEVLGSGWTHIKYEEQDAYINSKYVKLVDADKVELYTKPVEE